MSIATPVLNLIPKDVDSAVRMATRDVEAAERHVVAIREDLRVAQDRLDYLRETQSYWEGVHAHLQDG